MIGFIKKHIRNILLVAICIAYIVMMCTLPYPGIPVIGLIFTVPTFFYDEDEP